jgi:hypothetical protein
MRWGSTTVGASAAMTRLRRHASWFVVAAFLVPIGVEAFLQWREDRYVHDVATRAIREAHATTPREQVIALRDYVRAHVTFHGADDDHADRPFFRATAEDTLRSGLGYCGEDSRAFINLSRSVGIEAQRVNLYGRVMHVVAEVELEPHQRLVVDAQSPPLVVDLEPLDEVILRPEYDDYYTLNLRRLHLGWLVSRVRLEMGPLTYWAENPHALTAALWGLGLAAVLALRAARVTLRYVLHRRGWVHRSALPMAVASAASAEPERVERSSEPPLAAATQAQSSAPPPSGLAS